MSSALPVNFYVYPLATSRPDATVQPCILCGPKTTVDLNASLAPFLKGKKETHLSNEKGLSVLKSIKWKSDLIAWIAQPRVIVPLCLAIIAGVLFCPVPVMAPTVALIVLLFKLLITLPFAGIAALEISSLRKNSNSLRDAYAKRAADAAHYISRLEADKKSEFLISENPL